MSVCNIFLATDKIICLTDTVVYSGGAGSKAMGLVSSKCFFNVAQTFAICGRGDLAGFIDALSFLEQAANFDEAKDVLSKVKQKISLKSLRRNVVELTLMGWSEQADALRSISLTVTHNKPDVVSEFTPGLHLHPHVAGARLPDSVDEDVMVKIALAQYKVKEKFAWDHLCIGGLMHVSVIKKDCIERYIAGAYPDYEPLCRHFTCPNRDEYLKTFPASNKELAA
jgi:hypothetical protein